MKTKVGNDKMFNFFVYFFAILMIFIIVYPLWFIIIASFSDSTAVANGEIWLLPKKIQFDAYRELFKQSLIWSGYKNTIIYTAAGTLFQLIVNVTAGYAMSRKDFLGKKFWTIYFTIPMFISGGLIPTYLTVKQFGLVDNRLAMVLPFAVSCYNIIVIRTFFKSNIPDSLWEAAQMDGCSTFRYFIQIVLPLSKAILAVIGLWSAVGIWNSWFDAMIYLTREELQPLQLVLRRLLIINESLIKQGSGDLAARLQNLSDKMKYAAILVSTLPIMCLYPFLQKYFNQGVMVGSIKE
ncbi:carbohydrate ABC transporter permease [Anaerocolumna xylanovorans]|uniref:Putative aldouronate transport system permease protein n=1 Tax=Anaerocolumna xylanovorans DSM 12503 TaxID=1121345 RepID=A0A1M7Y561_9FIRM|nr:carbohydrate ABC transporter permease [Anaerocolumna xylanovorans]SHO47565.1 putative aldouronate transport system permease protein [Anaerocolumna xylanovorans DSM 12503]